MREGLGEKCSGVGGFKIAVLRSKTNSLKGNSSNFESSLLANCEGHAQGGWEAAHKSEIRCRPFANCTDLQPRQ